MSKNTAIDLFAGHRQAQTTMRYVSVTPDMKRAAVEQLT